MLIASARRKVFLWFVALAVTAPVALAGGELVTGFCSLETFAASWSWGATAWFVLSAVAGWAGLSALVRRLERHPDNGWFVLAPLLFWLAWGLVNHVGFSVVFHAGSSYASDLGGQLAAALYLGAVGVYWSILGILSCISDFEVLVPFRQGARGEPILAGRLNVKLFLGVVFGILTYLFGAIGVTLMPFHAGLSLIDGLIRVLIVAFPFCLMTVLMVIFLSRIITVPMVKASPLILTLGQDDLRPVLPEPSRDELGLVFHSLNLFLERLRVTVGEARDLSRANGDLSRDLDRLVDEQRDLLSQVASQVSGLETRLEKLGAEAGEAVDGAASMGWTVTTLKTNLEVQTGAVGETSAAAEQLLAGARNIAEVARSRKQSADALGRQTEENRQVLQGALEAMRTVTGQIESLTELNKVIAKVASQTNLLAMNAAIEAAHAGDAGRGFSVVAQEIRTLAESSAQNAKNSSAFLKGVVESIRKSGERLEAVDRSFLEGQTITTGVLEGFEEIGTGSAEIEQASQVIVERMVRLQESNRIVNEGASVLDQGLASVDRTARQSKEGVVASLGETRSLREISARLSVLAGETAQDSETLKQESAALASQFGRFTLPSEPGNRS